MAAKLSQPLLLVLVNSLQTIHLEKVCIFRIQLSNTQRAGGLSSPWGTRSRSLFGL